MLYDPLQRREAFHLAFLRAFTRSVPAANYALKGGSNLRFFFGSIRYSEDMDLDASGIDVHVLQERVMSVLTSPGFRDALRVYGIDRIQPPDLKVAKQTETVQRFKVHLITTAGEDLSTKIEFSRRPTEGGARAEAISPAILAAYRMPPLIVSHYPAEVAARQKLQALISRRQPAPRDVFDLYTLSTQPEVTRPLLTEHLSAADRDAARERTLSMDFHEFRDQVVSFLGPEDQKAHDSPAVWDEIRLRVVSLLEGETARGR